MGGTGAVSGAAGAGAPEDAASLWRFVARRLGQAGVQTPLLDAEVLLRHVMGWEREQLLRAPETEVTAEQGGRLAAMAAARCAGVPVARLLGRKEFWSLQFALSKETLIPRPESETLVAAALEGFGETAAWRILDLGCGCGCLLLALLWERRRASGLGIDISAGAVATAAGNARALGLGAAACFRQGDWAAGIAERFDLVVSNPPYIPSRDIAGLQAEVRLHDPRLALDGGADGMDALRAVVEAAALRLRPGGRLLVETGDGQARRVAAYMAGRGYGQVAIRRDIAGAERVVAAVAGES